MPADSFSNSLTRAEHHRTLYRRLRDAVVAEHEAALATATGWKKHWLLWKIDLLTTIRYNHLLFSKQQPNQR